MPARPRPRRSYRLPPELRAELAAPFGPVVTTAGLRAALGAASPVVAVGDVVSLTLLEVGVTPRFFVCDYKTQRGQAPLGAGRQPGPGEAGSAKGPTSPHHAEPLPGHHFRTQLGKWGAREVRVRSPAGELTGEAWDAVAEAMQDAGPAPLRIVVEGEEDLLGIPCLLEAPNGAAVLYGMPGEGVVVVHVTSELRRKVAAIVARMTPT